MITSSWISATGKNFHRSTSDSSLPNLLSKRNCKPLESGIVWKKKLQKQT